MTRLRVLSRGEVGEEAWDAFVSSTDEGWLWHRYRTQDALATWPGTVDASFAVASADGGGELCAVVPLRRVASRFAALVPVSTLESLGGVAAAEGLSPRERRAVFAAVKGRVGEIARAAGSGEWNLHLSPMSPALRGERCPRVNPLLGYGFRNRVTQTWIVDLRGGEGRLWRGLEGRARTDVRKARAAGFRVRAADREGDLDLYYGMHVETYRRTGVSPHPKAYFAAVWEHFVGRGLARVFFAELGGAPVAGVNVGLWKGGGFYWMGASRESCLGAGANHLLQWHAMEEVGREGAEWYECGEAFPGVESGKLKGINDFKRSFGGEMYPYYHCRLSFDRFSSRFVAAARTLLGRE